MEWRLENDADSHGENLGFRCFEGTSFGSLSEFMNFKLFGKTILVVNIKFELFLGHPLSK